MAGNPAVKVIDPDEQFFSQHPDRQARIRLPRKVPTLTPQRAVRMVDECEGEFWSLGEHNKQRRRIILWRVPKDRWHAIPNHDGKTTPVMKIPFLSFADEAIEDADATLLPIIDEIMRSQT